MRRSLALVQISLILAAICAYPSLAHQTPEITVAELVQQAHHVVEGDVVHLQSSWNPERTAIFTRVDVAVSESFKGWESDGQVELRLLGGQVDGIGMTVTHTPEIRLGERVILFLHANTQSLHPFVSGEAGKFTVAADPGGGEDVVLERGTQHSRIVEEIRRESAR